MQIDIMIRDLEKSEFVEAYLLERLNSTLESFLKNDENGYAKIRVEMDRHRTLNRKPSYICEIVLKPSFLKQPLKVSKRAEDFYVAANEAMNALKTILRRRSGRKAQHRRHEHARELQNLLVS